MDEKIEEVIGQYDLEITAKRRVRGAILLEGKESYLLREFRGNKNLVTCRERIKQLVSQREEIFTDQSLQNRDGQWLTQDQDGASWMVSRWYGGKECDIRKAEEAKRAGYVLGRLHRAMVFGQDFENEVNSEVKVDQENRDSQGQEAVNTPFTDYFGKKNRELRRIYNYLSKKRKKNELELMLLDLFPYYISQAKEARELEQSQGVYGELLKQSQQKGYYLHGNYNYHNLLFVGSGAFVTSFEHTRQGVQILDLYGLLRKIMEKNHWNQRLGEELIACYEKERGLTALEKNFLYMLLLYPEKYWKQCNFYYNGKKSWMPNKNYEKVLKIQGQENCRMEFLKTVKSLLF